MRNYIIIPSNQIRGIMLQYNKNKILFINLSLIKSTIIFLVITFYSHMCYATTALKADIATSDNATIFYLRLDKKPESVSKFTLDNPERVILDIKNLTWNIDNKIIPQGIIKRIRFGQDNNNSRIVFDITQKITSSTITISPHPNATGLYLLKLTLSHFNNTHMIQSSPHHAINHKNNAEKKSSVQTLKQGKFYSEHQFKPIKRRNPNDIIITIDAGHGGNDPGAKSVSGFNEKNIVLAFAKELASSINRHRNMQAILTRDSDFFIPLDERPLIASHYKSDLFISIHADALEDKKFSGSTVYTLSDTASDAIAAQIAESENRSDTIAGVNFDNQLPEITDILIDFMRRETDIASYEFAENLVQKLQKNTVMVPTPHRKAGFRVLKSPNIPSVLIELGYLTSIDDERRLTNPQKRRTMIASMISAIQNWHYQRRLSGH